MPDNVESINSTLSLTLRFPDLAVVGQLATLSPPDNYLQVLKQFKPWTMTDELLLRERSALPAFSPGSEFRKIILKTVSKAKALASSRTKHEDTKKAKLIGYQR